MRRPRRITRSDYRAAGRGLARDLAEQTYRADPTPQTAMAYATAAKAANLSVNVHAAIAAELEAAGFKDAMLALMA